MEPLVQLAEVAARREDLDPALVCAICEAESNWDPFAIRCESEAGFAARYGANYARIIRASASQVDDKWFQFEDLFYTSYGLMQTLYCVIVETFPGYADRLKYPTYLCDPEVGLAFGCKLFRSKLDRAVGDTQRALLYWNGGGDPAYPDKVLSKVANYAANFSDRGVGVGGGDR